MTARTRPGRGNVRTHTRRTATGGTTTVRAHSRKTRGRAIVSPRHAWRLLTAAWRHGRRRRRGMALALGALGVGELAAWLTLRGVFLILATAGALAIGAAVLAATASGTRT